MKNTIGPICGLIRSCTFIKKRFNRLFTQNDAEPVVKKLEQAVYQRLHTKLLLQPTRREKIVQRMMKDPVKSPENLQT